MKVIRTEIPEVLILEPRIFTDERGFFFEGYNKATFLDATGLDIEFVQDNQSRSTRNVLRGLHYQIHRTQGKLVRVLSGEIYDIAVDLRRSSTTFGKWVGMEVSDAKGQMVWIPPGFAHGFLVKSDSADVLYKTTDYYSPSDERTLLWNDPDLAIEWPTEGPPIIAAKDRRGTALRDSDLFN